MKKKNLIIIGTLFILGIIIGFCGGYMYSQGNTINNTTNNTTTLNTTDTNNTTNISSEVVTGSNKKQEITQATQSKKSNKKKYEYGEILNSYTDSRGHRIVTRYGTGDDTPGSYTIYEDTGEFINEEIWGY